MSVKTQGTELYVIDPDTDEVLNVGCITSIDGIDTPVDQIETTCLNELARTYVAGLASPGTATFAINTDLSDSVHVRLHELKRAGVTLSWAIGWSDGTGTDPASFVDSNGESEFDLPATRSWLIFQGYMSGFSFAFAQNAVVTSSVGIQISGDVIPVPAGS
ncbi:prophage LambdaSo, major tail protein V [Alcanivorax xiamenensis]|uniref:Prophage LambdaSo, major tail protein V n=1 Tax=Alcanivorax xiamenensis TaxID=1177156 RepID=A0ABQ6Y6F0_9GAMM|nr:phage tail tube protein [Alcanivorax xiamenensis]KAF0804931.1 prophage LambdaSo, major tail protein V [Alcanivorax xiamenensis]